MNPEATFQTPVQSPVISKCYGNHTQKMTELAPWFRLKKQGTTPLETCFTIKAGLALAFGTNRISTLF
jgi:hypothetical protein